LERAYVPWKRSKREKGARNEEEKFRRENYLKETIPKVTGTFGIYLGE